MSEGGNSYMVLQAVEALDVSPKKVYELMEEGTLELRLDEQTGCWRIDARSFSSKSPEVVLAGPGGF